ncbi:hypothetical protein ABIA39_000795 [Nocardia sp. GAS34]
MSCTGAAGIRSNSGTLPIGTCWTFRTPAAASAATLYRL